MLMINNNAITLEGVRGLVPFSPSVAIITPGVYSRVGTLGMGVVSHGFYSDSLSNTFYIIDTASSRALGNEVFRLYGRGGVLIGAISSGRGYKFVFPTVTDGGNVATKVAASNGDPVCTGCLGRLFIKVLRDVGRGAARIL